MYSERIISFIDVLGFKKLVQKEDCEVINDCISVIKDTFSSTDGDLTLGRRTTYFSDTIVTSIPTTDPNGSPQKHGMLYHELSALALAQADFYDRMGVLVRGGITIGDMVHDEDRLFGPAVIEAHELEQAAKFPRILIARKLFERYFGSHDLLARHHSRHSDDYKYIKPIVFRDRNKDRSVDYLRYSLDKFDDDRYAPIFLQKHKKGIIGGLEHHDPNITAKYLWLASYHNSIVQSVLKKKYWEEFIVGKFHTPSL